VRDIHQRSSAGRNGCQLLDDWSPRTRLVSGARRLDGNYSYPAVRLSRMHVQATIGLLGLAGLHASLPVFARFKFKHVCGFHQL